MQCPKSPPKTEAEPKNQNPYKGKNQTNPISKRTSAGNPEKAAPSNIKHPGKPRKAKGRRSNQRKNPRNPQTPVEVAGRKPGRPKGEEGTVQGSPTRNQQTAEEADETQEDPREKGK